MAVIVKTPGWLADTLLSDHLKCHGCGENCLIVSTLRNAIAVATAQEQQQAREWRAKGFPRDA